MMPLRTSVAARFELRFHQRDDVGARSQQRRDNRQDLAQRDERHVDRHDVDRSREVGERQMARVEVLDDDDARVVAQPPVELPVADVERDDARRAALQQHVGEAAGRGADVERLAPRTAMLKCVERVRELEAAAADVRMVRRDERDLGLTGRPRCLPWSPADRRR